MELIMNIPGIYGSHPEDRARARELDRYLDSCEPWTDEDIKKAQVGLYDSIRYFGSAWDENLISYRLDMLVEFEEIMMSKLPSAEKIADMNDAMDKYIKLYCRDVVEEDPDAYCEKYCTESEYA
jgi:hypothetical protein